MNQQLNGQFRDEAHYRDTMKTTLDRVMDAFDAIDPDVIDSSSQFGALTLTFSGGRKCILSAQPSVQQLWMAVAAKGIAHHFNYDFSKQQWFDDKGQGIELFSYLSSLVKELSSVDIAWK